MTAPAIPGPPARPAHPADPAGPARYRPDAGGTRPGPEPGAGRPRRWPAASWRWFLLVWLAALVVLAANDPGRIIFDTKLGVDINAAEFIERLWPLWNPREWFGTLQNQYIGYAIPMAPFFLLGQALRVPVWVIERLWLSLLIAAGFWGMTKLATTLRIGSDASRLLAGTVFVLWPTFTIVIGSTSAAALPGLLVPWAVLPLATALQGRRAVLTGCARSGIAIALMGGVNAVSTICALVVPALYLVTHTRGRQRVKICLLWATAVAAATAWWAVPLLLQGRYSFNFLPYVEQADTTTKTMSADAFLRGTGNWTAYLYLGTPWLSAGWAMVANPVAIAAAAVAAAAGLAGLARRDMPEQLWLRLSVGLAAAAALAGYPGAFGGPLHGLIQSELNGTLAPFRNVSKLEPVLALALALGIAHAFGGASRRALPAPRGSRHLAAGVLLAPVTALCLAGLALPYLTGQILQPGSFTAVPRYWYQVAGFLAAHSPDQTALVVPGENHGIYLWGDPIDEPLEPLASSPWVDRSLVPYGGAGSQVFLDTAETAIESGQRVPGLAGFLARAGVRYVVVRNDLSPDQLGYTPPHTVLQTLTLSGFSRVASFGPLITGDQTNPGAAHQVQAYLPRYPAVEVFQAASAAQRPSSPAVALPVSDTELVSGGPDSLLQLTGQGLLGDQAAVIAGDRLAGRPALWAVTDGQRRQDTAFGLINTNTSVTYTATETNPVDDPLGGAGGPPRQILPVPAAGHQTVAVLSGAASVTASSYGSWLTYQPQYDPVNAFDGNSATSWAEGNPDTPVGQWIQITFDRTLDLPASIGVQLLDDGFSRSIANQLTVSTAAGSVGTATTPTNATQQLGVRPGPTRWLRITITGASNVIPGNPGAGIRDVLIPGVRVTRYLEPAEDSAAGESASAVAFSFHQSAPAPAGVADRAATVPLARIFTLPVPLRLGVTASAVAQPSAALDTLLGTLARPGKSALLVSASSTWGDLPEFGPDNLFNQGAVPWISGSSNPVISLSWHRARRISEIVVQPAYGFAAAPTKIKVTSFFGTREATIGLGGVATLTPPLTTNELELSFPGWAAAAQPGTSSGQPVLGLAKLTIPALAGLHVAAPDPGAGFSLACGSGPVISMDSRDLATAVSGTLGELTGGLPVDVRLCTPGSAVTLGNGKHRLYVAPGLFTTTDVALRSAAPPTSPSPFTASATPARTLRVLSWQPDSRAVRIGPGRETYVEVHQNANPGWEATLDGHRLASATLDGWQQGFIVPAGAGGVITMTFAPATWYHIGLALAALAFIGMVAVAAGWRRWMSYVIPAFFFAVLESGTILLLSGTRLAAVWEPLEVLSLLAVAVVGLAYVRFRRQPGRVPPAAPAAPAAHHAPAAPAAPAVHHAPAAIRPARGDEAARKECRGSGEGVEREWRGAGRWVGGGRWGPGGGRLHGIVRWLLPWTGPAAVAVLILLVGGPVVLAVPVLAVIAALWPRWLPVVSLVAMLAAGLIAATAADPATLGGGAFGPAGQACALLALAAALYPVTAAQTADRNWRPARPLPGRGTRSKLAASDRRQPLGIGGPPPTAPRPPPTSSPLSTPSPLSLHSPFTTAARGTRHAAGPGPGAVQAGPGASAFRPVLRRAPFGIADELSCYYDAPAEPCNVHVEVRVAGHLDSRALRYATAGALAAQPRALARRAPGAWWRRYAWEVPAQPDCDPVTTAAWADEDELARVRARFLSVAPPLRSSPPLRVLLAAGPGEDRVILNTHHAALDGLSSLDLLRSVARHYPGGAAEDHPADDPGAPGVLPPAGATGEQDSEGGRGGGRAGRAARIAADRQPGRAAALPGYGFLLLPGRPVPAGRRAGGTVNDLLIAGLVVAIGRWNAAHGRRSGRIRITMPVNARPQGQAGTAGNLSRLTAVSVPVPSAGCDLGELVADVAAQTRAVKRLAGPQVDPASRALAAAWCPPAVKRGVLRLALRTAGPLLCDTSLVSNLGVAGPPRFGAAAVTGMWFSTSAHMPRGLSVGAVTVGGRLHLCLRYRRALFSEPSAVRFAGLYATALENLTSQGGAGDG